MGNCFDHTSSHSGRYMRPNLNYDSRQTPNAYRNQPRYKGQHRNQPYPTPNWPRQAQAHNEKHHWNPNNTTNGGFPTLQMYYQNLPLLRSQNFRSKLFVFFNTNQMNGTAIKPYPLIFDPKNFKRDKNYVYMPFTPSLNRSGQTQWSLINQTLISEFTNVDDLERAIKKYATNLQQYQFDVFHGLSQQGNKSELINLVNQIKNLGLSMPNYLTQQVPFLKQGENTIIFMSQMQIAVILANAFLCTFPWRTHRNKEYSNYPTFNFASKSAQDRDLKMEKLKCILNYFRRVIVENPKGVVSFERKCLNKPFIDWRNSRKPFKTVEVYAQGKIEDHDKGLSEVDFANKYIGGGVITSGCVQEEIRFLLSPELIISRLFTESLADNEAMVITGVERFNTGEGYSNSFRFKENYMDQTPRDGWGRRFTQIIAIDAICYKNKQEQFEKRFIDRELNKAYSGFMLEDNQGSGKPAIATGKWGCGAFNGDPHLKCLIQIMAAAQADRDLVVFTDNDHELAQMLKSLHMNLRTRGLNVGTVYQIMIDFKSNMNKANNVIEFVSSSI